MPSNLIPAPATPFLPRPFAKSHLGVIAGAIFLAISSAHAVTLVGYDIPTSTTNNTLSPMSSATGVTATSITAGPGLSFSTNNTSSSRWQATSYNQTAQTDVAMDAANTGGDYWAFSVTAATGYNLTINGIGSFQWGASTSGPKNVALLYSSNSFSTYSVVIKSQFGANGNTNLTSDWNAALAAAPISVAAGQTASFRIVGYGASSTGGTGGMLGNLTAPDFSVLGDSISTTAPFSWTGGSGSWAVGTTANWQSGGAAAAWVNGRDAGFANGGSLSVDSGGVNAGTLSISGATALSFSGGTVSASAVTLASGSSLSLGASGLSTATLDLVDAAMSGGSCTVTTAATASVSSGSKTFSTVLNGNATFTKSGAGELVLASSNRSTGQVGAAAGTLTTSAAELLPDGAVLKVDPLATFKLGGNETVGNLLVQTNTSGTGNIDLQNFTLTYGGNNGSTTNSAQTTGAGGFVKNGTGSVLLNMVGTYTGGFVLNQGTVRFTTTGTTTNGAVSNSVFGTGPLTLNGGSTITSSSASSGRSVHNAITLNGNVQFGDSAWATTNAVMNTNASGSQSALFTAGNLAGASTTLLGDSTIYTINLVDWYQAINGNFRITKDGTGAASLSNNYLKLRASNNIAGVTVAAGIVGYANRNAFGSGILILGNGVSVGQDGSINNSPLTGNDQADRAVPNDVRLDGNVIFGLGGTANHFGGSFDLNNATRVITLGNTTFLYGRVTNGGLTLDNGTAGGTRTLTLAGSNSYSGGTLVRTNAALAVAHDQALGSGNLTFTNTSGSGTAILRASTLSTDATQVRTIANNIELATGSVVILDAVSSAQDSTGTSIPVALNMVLAGNISGGGGLIKSNNNTVTLSGNNTYTGGTTVVNGSLVVVKPAVTATITTNSVSLVFSNGTAVGNYAVLPGALTGTYAAASVSGLDASKKATFDASTGVASVVAKTSQSISFGSLPVKSTVDAAFALSANASSGLPVIYSSSAPGVATVSGNTVTIVGPGTTVITATQAGDATYAPATPVAQTLTVLASADKATISQDFQVSDTSIPLSQQAPGWSSNDPNFRPDGYSTDNLNPGNLLGMVGGFYIAPSNETTELTYRFAPGNSKLLTFTWDQNISRSSSLLPGDDTFGWKFVSGNATVFSIKFLNDNSQGRDLLVQGYDAAGTALTLATKQENDWYIDRDDANRFRVTVDLVAGKWYLEVFNKATSTWFGLVNGAAVDPAITSVDGMVATWKVADNTLDAGTGQYLGAGDNYMAFDNLTIQGKQAVTISLNLPVSNPVYNGLSQALSPTTTPTGVALTVKYNNSTNAPVNAGIYAVKADVVDTNSYFNTATTGSLIVDKASPSITSAPTASGITYGQTLADSSLSGGAGSVAGSFAFTTPSTAPNAGTANQGITFTPTDTANYNTTTGTVSVAVAKASQTITFPWLPNGTVGGSAALTATSNAGLTISYSSSDTSVATISGSTVNFVGAGLVSITASQAGNSNYEAASDDTITFSVISATTPAEDYLSSFGLTGANAALTADPDNDGLTNAAEFAFGTSPVAATGTPVAVSDSGSSLTITFLGRTSGVSYVVKTTTDLSNAFSGSNAPAAVSPQPSGLPTGYTQYEASVDTTSGDRKFLKVDATLQ